MISIGLIQYTFYDAMRSELIYASLNGLIEFVHGNCMGVLELIYYYLKGHDSKDTVADAIHTILISRKGSLIDKSQLMKAMQERNEVIMKMISKIMKFKTGNKLFSNTSSKGKSIQSILSKTLNSITTIDLQLTYESIQSIAKQLPRTVVKQGPIALPIVKSPFLPPLKNDAYTLVLDLDETLVHYYDVFGC